MIKECGLIFEMQLEDSFDLGNGFIVTDEAVPCGNYFFALMTIKVRGPIRDDTVRASFALSGTAIADDGVVFDV